MNLKELTWENHKKAERSAFAKVLLSGKISPKLYYQYLTNQFYSYNILENALRMNTFPYHLESVFRAELIKKDLQELEAEYGFVFDPALLTCTTVEYISHVEELNAKKDLHSLVAHMYVRHFGDMYGGAIIRTRVPGTGHMYEFEDKETLKTEIRKLLSDDMADEANTCFAYAVKLFSELAHESSLG